MPKSKETYFKIIRDGEVVDIIKATHSNIALRAHVEKMGIGVKSASIDDVLDFKEKGGNITKVPPRKFSHRPKTAYDVKGVTET